MYLIVIYNAMYSPELVRPSSPKKNSTSKTLDEIFGNQTGSVYYEGPIDGTSTENFDES